MEAPQGRRIAVTGGGTAGHILPGLEFLQTYRREFGATGYFIGCAAGLETRLVPDHGERLELIPGLPFARQGPAGKLRALFALAAAILAARRLLRREQTELVIGTGGYASLSVSIAAWSLGIPVVLHEANAEPGLANRIAARFARLVCLGFDESRSLLRGPVEVTGIPTGTIDRVPGSEAGPFRFLVLGGSEGSPGLNRRAPGIFAELRRRGLDFSLVHICGFGDAAAVAREYALAGVPAEVHSFVDDMRAVYRGATAAIASAGARTLAELSAAGIPSVLVPLPGAANDHQTANARLYAARTGAAVFAERQLDPAEAAGALQSVVADLRRRRDAASSWSNRDAALKVVQACERLSGSRAGVGQDRILQPTGTPPR